MRTQITDAMKRAMKSKQTDTLQVIRMVQARIKDADIAARAKGNTDGVNDNHIVAILKNMVKQRSESAALYTDANRPELAAKETAEIAIIETFLPAMMDETAITQAVDTAIAAVGATAIADMGKVMGYLKSNYDATLDMATASKILKTKLS